MPSLHYQNKDATKWAFYDRSIRSWTCTERDAQGNQVGSAIYFAQKSSAMTWLTLLPTVTEMPEVGGEPMGSFHPPEPTKPAFDGLSKGDYFARKTARQNATKVKGQ